MITWVSIHFPDLPDLLRDALQSSTVVDLLKTCSKCSCNSDANDLKSREATLCSVEETSPTREMSSEELNSWSQSPDPPKDENQETKFWISSRNVSLSVCIQCTLQFTKLNPA